MNEKQLMAFVQWLPTKIKELQNRTPEQIVEVLNSMSQSPEGQKQLEALVQAFQQETGQQTGMYKKGGKLDYLVSKLQNGGKYNRKQAREDKKGIRPTDGDRNAGHQNVIAKKKKAANVEGFNESMYNMNPLQYFDRNRYKARKSFAEGSRRQRKAFALMDDPLRKINAGLIPAFNTVLPTPFRRGLGTVEVGELSGEVIPNKAVRKVVVAPEEVIPTPNNMGWDEFATYAERNMRNHKDYRNGINLAAMQKHIEDEYNRYLKSPDNYKWQFPTAGYKADPNWKSQYGGWNSSSGNWGGVDRSAGMFRNGGKTPKMQLGGAPVKNPNDVNAIRNALANRSGDRKTPTGEYIPSDVYSTTRGVLDSLINIGYNPTLVRKYANPMLQNAWDKWSKQPSYQAEPEAPTDRQARLNDFNRQFVGYREDGGKVTSNINGYEYTVEKPDTVGNIVTRRIYRDDPNSNQYNITIQKQFVGDPTNTSYFQFKNIKHDADKGNPVLAEIRFPNQDRWFSNDSKMRSKYDEIFADLFKYNLK